MTLLLVMGVFPHIWWLICGDLNQTGYTAFFSCHTPEMIIAHWEGLTLSILKHNKYLVNLITCEFNSKISALFNLKPY